MSDRATISSQARIKKDNRLAIAAAEKMQRKEDPSNQELAALRRVELREWEKAYALCAGKIPKKTWRLWTGRSTSQLRQQCEVWGLPVGEATIDMAEVANWIHRFLAEHAKTLLNAKPGDDPLLEGDNSPALEKYRYECYLVKKLDRLEREKVLLPREGVMEILSTMAEAIRNAGEQVERKYDKAARLILEKAIRGADKAADKYFAKHVEAEEPEVKRPKASSVDHRKEKAC